MNDPAALAAWTREETLRSMFSWVIEQELDERVSEEAAEVLLDSIHELHDDSLADLSQCPGCAVLQIWRPAEFVRCPGCGTERRYEAVA